MEKINQNAPIPQKSVFEKMRDLVFSDALTAVAIRLSVAKNAFSLLALLYYGFYLATVGWLLGSEGTIMVFLLFPTFLFSLFTLAYFLLDYGLVIYLEKVRWFRFVALFIFIVCYAALIAVHFGLIPSIL